MKGLKNKTYHAQRAVQILRAHNADRVIDMSHKLNPDTDNQRKNRNINYDINTRAILSAFKNGTRGADIAKFVTLFGFPGGRGLEREFHRKSPDVIDEVIKVV